MNIFHYILHVRALLFCLLLCIPFSAFSQTIIDQEEPLFSRQNIKTNGRIRHLTVEHVTSMTQKDVVVFSRQGNYPNWKGILTVYKATNQKLTQHSEIQLPDDTISYGFKLHNQIPHLFLVLPDQILILRHENQKWTWPAPVVLEVKTFTTPSAKASATPFSTNTGFENEIWIPTSQGYEVLSFEENKWGLQAKLPFQPKSFYRTPVDLLAFEMSYWFKSVHWFSQIDGGTLDGKNQFYFSGWMDEIEYLEKGSNKPIQKHFFNLLDEKERDDGQHYVTHQVVDLNGDGRVDFLLNKFQGAGTNFRSSSYYYLTTDKGEIASKPVKVPFSPKTTSGALVFDINQNGKQDFVIASSQLNVWSMIRALTKRQVLMTFDMHFFDEGKNGYNFQKADISREILFDFSLKDFFIDGILPTMDGDFNGDGYPDVMYARNPKELTFLTQQPKSKDRFGNVPSGLFNMDLPKNYQVGDINGDKKTDLIFFSTRSGENEGFILLLNSQKF